VWGSPPHYDLLIEFDGDAPSDKVLVPLSEAIDAEIERVNAEFERKKATLRLGTTRLRVLDEGARARYIDDQVKAGREAARVKLPRATTDLEFARSIGGRVIAGKARGEGEA
jgi:hypothetical protein